MSQLTLGLALVGGLVLAVVVAHGAWTSRRAAPRQADAPAPPPEPRPDDAGISSNGNEKEGAAAENAERREPVFDDSLAAFPVPPLTEYRRQGLGLDPLIDAIAPIVLEAFVTGEAALAALPPTRRVGSKPFAVEGRDAAGNPWEPPAPGRRYAAFQAGVQLANRGGALNEIEYSEFVVKAQAFADAVNGSPEFPDMLEEVARARELDQFASAHDAQLGFTLRARYAAWSPGYAQQHAARLGFVPGTMPGRLVLPAAAPSMPPVLSLAFDAQAALADDPAQTPLRELTLSLDAPQVARAERPFQRLREAAQALADSMDGVVTDDNGQPLTREAMDSIGAELELLYDRLDARELPAGCAVARRLFS